MSRRRRRMTVKRVWRWWKRTRTKRAAVKRAKASARKAEARRETTAVRDFRSAQAGKPVQAAKASARTKVAVTPAVCGCCGKRHTHALRRGEHCGVCTAHRTSTPRQAPARQAQAARAGRCGQKTADGTPCRRQGACPPGTHSARRSSNRKGQR